jgi:non-specific serine/threonine protein kinase
MVAEVFSLVAEPLTKRELHVLGLLSRGLFNREIADELVVTPGTVKWYNKQIYRKLGVNSRTKAIAQANKTGLFEQPLEITETARVGYAQNLPAPLTSFIGRETEVREIKHLLDSNRLITLTGPGGSGKSRIALQVASKVADQFLDGVFVVDLATVHDTHLLLDMIARTLGIREIPGKLLINTLKQALSDKRMLLILDNFERIIAAGPHLSELLSTSPDLKVLVTSREPLMIYDEHVYKVPPLSKPDLEDLQSAQELMQYESMQLFYQRAAAVKTGFTITDKNAPDIAEICVRLDGLPLAIELAAARSNLFSPEMLRKRLDSRLAILTGGSRDLPPRMQTLRGTFDWSYDLLDPEEQRLLSRLSVFQGGRTVDSCGAVCAQGLSINILDGLESLLNKNLLYQEQVNSGEPRFYMLETIKLHHSLYFSSLVSEAEQESFGPQQDYWLEKLRLEYDNLRTALEHTLGGADVIRGFKIVGALRFFWYSNGLIAEGLRWIERALKYKGDVPLNVRAKAYVTAAELAFVKGDLEKDKFFSRKAVELAQESGDQQILAWALLTRSKSYTVSRDQAAEGIPLGQESLTIFRKVNYIPGMTVALNVLGELSRQAGDYEHAEEYYREGLQLSRQAGDKRRVAVILSCLSLIAMHQGEYQQAQQLGIESLEMEVALGIKYYIAMSLACLSGPVAMLGHPKKGVMLLGASQSILEALGAVLQPPDQMEVDKYLVIIKEQLDEESFKNALAEGRRMSFEEAVSFALNDPAF